MVTLHKHRLVIFFFETQKAQETKGKIDKIDSINIKTIYSSNDTVNEKTVYKREKISNNISDNDLVSSKYKRLSYNLITKKSHPIKRWSKCVFYGM